MKSPAWGPSLLFCPGDRPDRFDKAFDRADGVILDLEDSVAPAHKDAARESATAAAAQQPDRAILRVNGVQTRWFVDDVSAARAAGVRTLLLPKADDPAVLKTLTDFEVVVLVESAAGALAVRQLLQAENCVAVMWGGEDLVADLGGVSSRGSDGRYRPLVEQVRSTCLLAAAATRKVAIDAIHVDITDIDGLRRETQEAADLGFESKACIHPTHTAIIREAFRPTEEQMRWAETVLSHPGASAGGVFRVGTQMIDAPLLQHARNTAERAR